MSKVTKFKIKFRTRGYDYSEAGGMLGRDTVKPEWRELTRRDGSVGVYSEEEADELIESFESIGVKVKKVSAR